MTLDPTVLAFTPDAVALRRDIHAHPETGFNEHRTAALIAENLAAWGIAVTTGLGGTGVVGVLEGNRPGRTIGLRSDIDALPMQSALAVAWASTVDGVFHGCGHDGHTATLLLTARALAATRDFAGRVIFIFQPAEEGLGGARAMIRDGLFARFPCDEVYAWHNWPDLPFGKIAATSGPVMAGADFFDITLHGQGAHAAMPNQARDVIPATGALLSALQTIVAREIDPLKSAVLSVTKVDAGSAYNVLPATAQLGGTLRYFDDAVGATLRDSLTRVAHGVAAAHGLTATVETRNAFSVTRNDAQLTDAAATLAAELFGPEAVLRTHPPSMGAEDFADMLSEVPGVYLQVGHKGNVALHNPAFAFDDDIMPVVATLLMRIVAARGATRDQASPCGRP